MPSSHRPKQKTIQWISVLGAPILGLIGFCLAYWFDPLNFGARQPISVLPAFMLSVVLLMIGQAITTAIELQKTSDYSDQIYTAIKDYLHVTPLGSPEAAFRYICSRMSSLREVKNTSFNVQDEVERAEEKFYDTSTYEKMISQIALHSCDKLIWKDIGDPLAIGRLRAVQKNCNQVARGKKNGYRFKLIGHQDPQINFILLEYEDGTKEVCFNWDFRGMGQDPTVLISRDRSIVEMFSIQFTLLWRHATEDHDSHAIRSNSVK